MRKSLAFDDAMNFTLRWEGGYTDDPDDPGGKTKYGITESTLRIVKRRGVISAQNVKELTREDAKRIYKHLYWDRLKCDYMPPYTALLVFDTAVNQGLFFGALHLQSALNDLHRYSDAPVYRLKKDGIIGKKTLSVANDVDSSSVEVKRLLIKLYCTYRTLRYLQLITRNSRLKKFAKGWFLRTADLQDFATSLV